MTRYIFPILLVLLSVLIYAFSIEPLLYGEIPQVIAKEKGLTDALATAANAQVKLDAIAKSYASFPPDAAERLAEILPEKIDPIRLVIETNAFMAHNGFSPKSLTIGQDAGGNEGDGSYKTHVITFSIAASYDTFREFLHVLESSLVLRDLSSVSFTTVSEGVADLGTRPELAIHNYKVQAIGYSLH